MPKSMPHEENKAIKPAEIHLIIDTNVVVSSFLKEGTPPWLVLRRQMLLPCFFYADQRMLKEYGDVLRRPKFSFSPDSVKAFEKEFISRCRLIVPIPSHISLPDPKDICFYETYLSAKTESEWTYLVSGNLHHFPKDEHIVSPRQLLDILDSPWNGNGILYP